MSTIEKEMMSKMLIKLDRYFIAELNKNGVDFDYKKLREIYLQSRKSPDCITHQNHLKWEQGLLQLPSLSKEEFEEKYKNEIEASRKKNKEEERLRLKKKKTKKLKKKTWNENL